MARLTVLLTFLLMMAAPVAGAQEATAPETATQEDPRAATGGAQTLEDILRRQEGLAVDDDFRRNAEGDRAMPEAAEGLGLGPRGGASDATLWRDVRFNDADVTTQVRGHAAGVLVQDAGMPWLQFREGPLAKWGGYAMLGMIGVLALFYLTRGRIRIDGPKTGRTILRFTSIERFGHWLFAGSFVILAITGLITLFGRMAITGLFAQSEANGGTMINGSVRYGLELMGPEGYDRAREAFATVALASKWLHNNLAWAFMLGLVMITVMWIAHNIPNRHDLKWLAVGGGLFSKNVHPPARKFNAGQKMIFWACVLLGFSISASGLSLLFPFELPMFAKTFAAINSTGVPAWFGFGPLPTDLAPHQEMQFAQAWHAIVGFVFMTIIIAHIYLGSVGMEGAFDAMGDGEVEEQWAREHHGLWVEEMAKEGRLPHDRGAAHSPAE